MENLVKRASLAAGGGAFTLGGRRVAHLANVHFWEGMHKIDPNCKMPFLDNFTNHDALQLQLDFGLEFVSAMLLTTLGLFALKTAIFPKNR